MKTYQREKYKLKAYEDCEQCKIVIEDDELHTVNEEYGKDWKILYAKSKKLVEEGKRIEIWCLKYTFEP